MGDAKLAGGVVLLLIALPLYVEAVAHALRIRSFIVSGNGDRDGPMLLFGLLALAATFMGVWLLSRGLRDRRKPPAAP